MLWVVIKEDHKDICRRRCCGFALLPPRTYCVVMYAAATVRLPAFFFLHPVNLPLTIHSE